ncbi:MAG TPA: putative toxin-antitoxin system toxin component, PIN family [Terriglobales bacterium]|nr:putative toxin-antitoxin system toxin component, PIN family [Terriglobales bacterium]
MRVVFDTNILISALVFPGQAELALNRIIQGSDVLLLSKPILDELLTVLARKFDRDREQLSRVALWLANLATWVQPTVTVKELADKADNRILECAVEGDAEQIVSGDKRLLQLGQFGKTRIVSLRDYLANPPR